MACADVLLNQVDLARRHEHLDVVLEAQAQVVLDAAAALDAIEPDVLSDAVHRMDHQVAFLELEEAGDRLGGKRLFRPATDRTPACDAGAEELAVVQDDATEPRHREAAGQAADDSVEGVAAEGLAGEPDQALDLGLGPEHDERTIGQLAGGQDPTLEVTACDRRELGCAELEVVSVSARPLRCLGDR